MFTRGVALVLGPPTCGELPPQAHAALGPLCRVLDLNVSETVI